MVEICSTCGLPKDICVCDTISKEQQRIKIYREFRKWRRPVTIIMGVDVKNFDMGKITHSLKKACACGGALKGNQIILQGDHRRRVRELLADLGFPRDNIEIS